MDDWDALEMRCGLAVTVGSNPTLSALQDTGDEPVSFFVGVSVLTVGRNGRQLPPHAGLASAGHRRRIGRMRNEWGAT